MLRTARVVRNTKETQICLELNLDGKGTFEGTTGIGFFDHMLDGFARHGFFDLRLEMQGDLQVDGHHTIEDFGIVLGTALKEALGDKAGIRRYGSRILPMDETLVLAAVDLCGRPYLSFQAEFSGKKSAIWRRRWSGVFLCPVLFLWDESPYQGTGRAELSSYHRGDVQGGGEGSGRGDIGR